jgi:hypothetical protein
MVLDSLTPGDPSICEASEHGFKRGSEYDRIVMSVFETIGSVEDCPPPAGSLGAGHFS